MKARETTARPLVVLTRASSDNGPLARELAHHGVDSIEIPTASLVARPPERGLESVRKRIEEASAVAFTSRHGVRAAVELGLLDVLKAAASLAAVGDATRTELETHGLTANVQPAASNGTALGESLVDAQGPGSLVVCLQAAHARPELATALRTGGIEVEAFDMYENVVPEPPDVSLLASAAHADLIYLAAPSAGDRLYGWAPELAAIPWVAIGPTTGRAVQSRHGHAPVAVAQDPTLAAVSAAILKTLAAQDRGASR